jgi:hypothetical protein
MNLKPHQQILLDVVEKICRLHNLSKAIAHTATDEERALLKFYNAQLEGVRKRLRLPIDQTLNETEFSLPDYSPLYDGLSYFLGLHPLFRVFATLPEVPKEVILSLENLLPKEIYESLKPTIIYSPLYNYFEFSSQEYFHRLGILLEKGIPDRIILMLPFADFENPLMWSILIHELSHAFEAKLGIIEGFAKNFTIHSDEVIRRSKSWAREFCCDIIAIKLMGPSYLNAFLNLHFSIHPWQYISSESHPQPHSRINYMSDYLEQSSLHSYSSKCYVKIFRELSNLFSIQEERFQLAIKQEDLIQGLEQEIAKIIFPDPMNLEHLSIILNLGEKLKSGLPLISSYRPINKNKITETKEKFLSNQDQLSGKEANIYNLLILAEEKPAKPVHILNAAWDFRAEKFWDAFTTIFTNSEFKYEEKFLKMAEYVEDFSSSVIKSLETSKIHETFMPR